MIRDDEKKEGELSLCITIEVYQLQFGLKLLWLWCIGYHQNSQCTATNRRTLIRNKNEGDDEAWLLSPRSIGPYLASRFQKLQLPIQ